MRKLAIAILFAIWSALSVVGCAETTSSLTFSEEPGGTCGAHQPVASLEDVCEPLGGVAMTLETDGATEVFCRSGFVAWGRMDHTTGEGVFTLTTDECDSSYTLTSG